MSLGVVFMAALLCSTRSSDGGLQLGLAYFIKWKRARASRSVQVEQPKQKLISGILLMRLPGQVSGSAAWYLLQLIYGFTLG